jgi:hypothetical protein
VRGNVQEGDAVCRDDGAYKVSRLHAACVFVNGVVPFDTCFRRCPQLHEYRPNQRSNSDNLAISHCVHGLLPDTRFGGRKPTNGPSEGQFHGFVLILKILSPSARHD